MRNGKMGNLGAEKGQKNMVFIGNNARGVDW